MLARKRPHSSGAAKRGSACGNPRATIDVAPLSASAWTFGLLLCGCIRGKRRRDAFARAGMALAPFRNSARPATTSAIDAAHELRAPLVLEGEQAQPWALGIGANSPVHAQATPQGLVMNAAAGAVQVDFLSI
jgi:hypothetical protein